MMVFSHSIGHVSRFILLGLSLLTIISCGSKEALPIIGQRTVDDNGQEVIHRVGDMQFRDQSGATIRLDSEKEKVIVFNTFFTSCPTICPRMTDNILTVFDEMKSVDDVVFVSMTVNPERDSSERLTLFMESHDIPIDDKWFFVTGKKQELYDFARYQILLNAMDASEEIEDDFIHSEKVVLIDKKRYIRGYYDGTVESDMKRLEKDIERLR